MQASDYLYNPYPVKRMPVFSKKGMVATSHPLAAQAGMDILKKGGNAIDAAIAASACLTVVEPVFNGIGGDAFVLVWTKGKLYGLNASGTAPKNISLENLKKKGIREMPKYGWEPVTVPGLPAAWAELSNRFGYLLFSELFKPAVHYADEGYPISPMLWKNWDEAHQTFKENLVGEQFIPWFQTFTHDGETPRIGEIWQAPDHAQTLQLIADTKGESFYRGELAEKIDQFSKQYGGYINADDLAMYSPDWVEPICVNYRGYDVWEIPPNGQGLVALMALNILKGFDFHEKDSIETYHKQIEAIKLAFADGERYITDPESMTVSVKSLLSDGYGEERRRLIGKEADIPKCGKPQSSGTVYLATADCEGNFVSFIQSNYIGFGSGLVVPGTGISLQNRGHNFSLDEKEDNRLEPGKRPYHTIIPGFLTKKGQPIGPFGFIGGFMQPQGHVQLIMNTIDFHLNPQAALDAPRWQWIGDRRVDLEHAFSQSLAEGLSYKGHDVLIRHGTSMFGYGQIIWRNPSSNVFIGGTESRTDGYISAW